MNSPPPQQNFGKPQAQAFQTEQVGGFNPPQTNTDTFWGSENQGAQRAPEQFAQQTFGQQSNPKVDFGQASGFDAQPQAWGQGQPQSFQTAPVQVHPQYQQQQSAPGFDLLAQAQQQQTHSETQKQAAQAKLDDIDLFADDHRGPGAGNKAELDIFGNDNVMQPRMGQQNKSMHAQDILLGQEQMMNPMQMGGYGQSNYSMGQ